MCRVCEMLWEIQAWGFATLRSTTQVLLALTSPRTVTTTEKKEQRSGHCDVQGPKINLLLLGTHNPFPAPHRVHSGAGLIL